MADDWYYTQSNERKGPVSPAKLRAMADDGWLTPDDLVWKTGMPNWVPAGKVRGLFGNALVQKLKDAVEGVVSKPAESETQHDTPSAQYQPTTPTAVTANTTPADSAQPSLAWANLKPRHLLAGCGGFIAALGIAFTAIAQSLLALAFTLSGLALLAVGMYVEVGRLLGQSIENISKASHEAADRRQEAKKLAVEKQRLDLEAKRLAHEQAALRQAAAPGAMAVASQVSGPAQQAPGGSVVVINQAPVRRWSPGLAAVLSLFLPGLGQLYKGQIINGIFWFMFVSMGYVALILPGLILHFFCVLGALSGNPWSEGKTTVVRQ
jgi:hypothetical protein